MARGKKKSNIDWKKETIDEAVKTGFLFGRSINYYENHTREELIQKGEDKARIDIAEEVLKAFETSVGAKLGKCKPELWSIRPCADCSKSVDTRDCNTYPVFGACLCKKCYRAKVESRRCIDCGDEYRDRSHGEFTSNPFGRLHYFRETEKGDRQAETSPLPQVKGLYVCRWCALFRGDMEFIEKRTPPPDRDKRILTAELRLVKKRKGYFPTIEELKRETAENPKVEYVYLPRRKENLEDNDSPLVIFKPEKNPGNKKKGFFIRYTGYVWRVYKEPPSPESIFSPDFLIYHPDDARKIVIVARVQIFHRDCQGYAEAYLDAKPRCMNLKNLNPDNAAKEARILLGARTWMFELERQSRSGRPPGRDKSRPEVLSALRGALVELGPEALWETVILYSGIKRATLYEYLEEYGITNEEIESLRDEVRKERGPTCLSCKRPL